MFSNLCKIMLHNSNRPVSESRFSIITQIAILMRTNGLVFKEHTPYTILYTVIIIGIQLEQEIKHEGEKRVR